MYKTKKLKKQIWYTATNDNNKISVNHIENKLIIWKPPNTIF